MDKKNKGLSGQEVKKRLKIYGPNKIKRKEKISPIKILISQFTSPLIILLLLSMGVSFGINIYRGENYLDSLLIGFIVLVSGLAGFIQDYKAERSIEALKKMATPDAKVIRDGKKMKIKAAEIVPGDIVILEGGDIINADARILEGNIEVNESVLTGESRSVGKQKDDNVYSSCTILNGQAIAIVNATGMKTKVGNIANKIQDIKEDKTPFQKEIKRFSHKLVIFTFAVIVVTFLAGSGKFGMLEAAFIAVSLAVAAIPEGLPAVITLALSLGAKNMVKNNALIRKLSITESIGSVDVICTDKTGTLTRGDMKVANIWAPKKTTRIKDISYKCANLCNDAKQMIEEDETKWIGDETDIALKKYAAKRSKGEGKRLGEISFTSDKKMMSVLQEMEGGKFVFVKGAPEVVIEKCSRFLDGDKIKKMSRSMRNEILDKNSKLAGQGYRVLALSYKKTSRLTEDKLVFTSLVYLSDPIRHGIKNAVRDCHKAGIRVIMITGDNPLTASAISKKAGIKSNDIFIGADLDEMSDFELNNIIKGDNNIFARTSPFHKLRILEIIKDHGYTAAMTGDGVNDALALKKSDVGIAMGIKGTEVSKQASDIILLDDNFLTIRNAIREGRRIFHNIRKFINYLLTCNLAEVLVILTATITLPFIALYPVQILWINLATDGLIALAISSDPAPESIMLKKPENNKGIINKRQGVLILTSGILMTLFLLTILFISLELGSTEKARTMLFTSFVLFEFVRIGVIKYNDKLGSIRKWFANKFLNYSLVISLLLHLVIIYTPFNKYFKVVSLNGYDWLFLGASTVIAFIVQIMATNIINRMTARTG